MRRPVERSIDTPSERTRTAYAPRSESSLPQPSDSINRVVGQRYTISGCPILRHILKVYAAYEVSHFIILLGYKDNLIKRNCQSG